MVWVIAMCWNREEKGKGGYFRNEKNLTRKMEILHINLQISRMGTLPASLPSGHSIPPYLRWKTGRAPWGVGYERDRDLPAPTWAREECHQRY